MRGSGVVIQPGGRGQTKEGWGARTATTTTSFWDDKGSREKRFVDHLGAPLGSPEGLSDGRD